MPAKKIEFEMSKEKEVRLNLIEPGCCSAKNKLERLMLAKIFRQVYFKVSSPY
jgi:hypothetical protein